VAERLELTAMRFKTADGNYLLRQSDFLVFGPLYKLNEYAAAVGGVMLRDAEAAANHKGSLNTPLPEALDPQWLPDPEQEENSFTDALPEDSPALPDDTEAVHEDTTHETAQEEDASL